MGSTVDSGPALFLACAWRAAPSVGAHSSCSLGCWRVLHRTTPCPSSPSLMQEVGGVTLLALPKPHPPETAGLPHPDPHPSLPTSTLFLRVPLCLLLTVLWTAVLKKHLVWLAEVEEGSRSCQLNCISHMPAIRGCLLYKSRRPRPPLGFSPLPSQLWSQPTL